MHISEGVLSPEIIIPSGIAAAIWIAYLIYRLKSEDIPKVACMSALFFCASFIHIPIGPTSVHLILSGLVGAILGPQALLAIFVGLALQAVFFGYGGVSVLGVNTLIIGAPAILAIFFVRMKKFQKLNFFLAGFVPISISSLLLSVVLALNGEEFFAVAALAFGVNIALMIIEGIISMFGLAFVAKINKDFLKC